MGTTVNFQMVSTPSRPKRRGTRLRSNSPLKKIMSDNNQRVLDLNEKLNSLVARNSTLEEENQYLFSLVSKLQNGNESEINSTISTYNQELSNLRQVYAE